MPATAKTTDAPARRFIDQLQPGEFLSDQAFLVAKKDLRTQTNGGLYIHLVLMDRSGQVLGRIWQATQEQFDSIPEGGFIKIRGRTESYKGNMQLIVDGLRSVEVGQLDISDFLPRTKHDIDEMWDQTLTILRTIKDPNLLALIKAFVKDEKLVAGFKKAPAALTNHHAYIGGLLEHTLNLLKLATRIFGEKDDSASLYPDLSRDLMLVGIFLHDIGKTAELTYETSFAYSTAGQLVGHITQAVVWIHEKAAQIGAETGKPFPADLLSVVAHLILSHHGAYEFGSPKLPACAEAFMLHFLDNIDAKVHMSLRAIEAAKKVESDWTEWVQPLGTRVFKKDVTDR